MNHDLAQQWPCWILLSCPTFSSHSQYDESHNNNSFPLSLRHFIIPFFVPNSVSVLTSKRLSTLSDETSDTPTHFLPHPIWLFDDLHLAISFANCAVNVTYRSCGVPYFSPPKSSLFSAGDLFILFSLPARLIHVLTISHQVALSRRLSPKRSVTHDVHNSSQRRRKDKIRSSCLSLSLVVVIVSNLSSEQLGAVICSVSGHDSLRQLVARRVSCKLQH